MDRLGQDLRFAVRGFRRTPGFFATAVIILAIGIGMSVAMFTVFRAVLIRQLPVVDQDRIAVMWPYVNDPNVEVAPGTNVLSVVRRESRTMRDIAGVAHWPATPAPFVDNDRTVSLARGMVTANFFDVVGARPALGRLFHQRDDEIGWRPGDTKVAAQTLVLSYRAWREKFGGDSSIIGRRLLEPLSRLTFTVVGVAPVGFDYPAGAEYWQPMWQEWNSDVSAFAVARLVPGATLNAARDEYLAVENRVKPEYHFRGAHAATFTDTVLGNISPVLRILTAAVGLLLLIACLNVGNLLLLRSSGRAREIAVRRALGAGYTDIVRQLLIEALALAIAGGALGFALSVALLRALIVFKPANLPRLDDIQLSGTPALVAIGITSLAVLAFGLLPALFAARTNLASPMRFDSRSGSETRRRRAVRQILVASQVALATIMLGGAALLARSLQRLEGQNAGYDADHLSILTYTWNAPKYNTLSSILGLAQRLTKQVSAIPGVTAATPLVVPPLLGDGVWQVRFDKEGQSPAEALKNPAVPAEVCGPDFFRTFGVSVIRGRAFTERDDTTSTLVAIVSESAARRLWPGEDPMGKRIRLPGGTRDSFGGGADWRTVIGVARDAHLRTVRDASPLVYLPYLQGSWQGSIAIRASVPLTALLAALRRAGHDADPQTELFNPKTMDQLLAVPLSQPRLGALLMSSFGLVALLLAAIGLYGVMAALVRDQTREIGIRIALGATGARVRGDVLRRAAMVTVSGAVVGLIIVLGTSRVLTTLLFRVSPTDPLALGGACVVLLAVATFAAYLPARRATRIDPVQALRAD